MPVGIVRGSKMRVVGRGAQRALVHVGLAHQHRTGGAQARHHVGIAFCRLLAARQPGAGRPTGHVKIVLQGQRDAVEAADDAVAAPAIRHLRLILEQARAHVDVGVELWIEALDGRLVGIGQGLRLHATDRQPVQQLAQAGAAQFEIGNRLLRIHGHTLADEGRLSPRTTP